MIQNRMNSPNHLGGTGFVLMAAKILQRALLVPETEVEGRPIQEECVGVTFVLRPYKACSHSVLPIWTGFLLAAGSKPKKFQGYF